MPSEDKRIPWEDVPHEVQAAILRLERKRIWRESLEQRIDAAEQRLDAEKEKDQ